MLPLVAEFIVCFKREAMIPTSIDMQFDGGNGEINQKHSKELAKFCLPSQT